MLQLLQVRAPIGNSDAVPQAAGLHIVNVECDTIGLPVDIVAELLKVLVFFEEGEGNYGHKIIK